MLLFLVLVFSTFSKISRHRTKVHATRNRIHNRYHQKRRRSATNNSPYIIPGINLTPQQTRALDQTKDLFMQFRFKQVFAKQMPKLLRQMFGKGDAGQARLKEFLMPQLMPIAVKGPDGKDQIALMPGMVRGRAPYAGGKRISGSIPDVQGAQFVPGGISPFHLNQGYETYQNQHRVPPEVLDGLLQDISNV